jgi:hypothetical protein
MRKNDIRRGVRGVQRPKEICSSIPSASLISNRPGDELPLLPSGAYPDTITDNPGVRQKRDYKQSLAAARFMGSRDPVEAAVDRLGSMGHLRMESAGESLSLRPEK